MFEGAKGEFRYHGTFGVSAGLSGMNSIVGERKGNCYLEFADGGKYLLGNPLLSIRNIVIGT